MRRTVATGHSHATHGDDNAGKLFRSRDHAGGLHGLCGRRRDGLMPERALEPAST